MYFHELFIYSFALIYFQLQSWFWLSNFLKMPGHLIRKPQSNQYFLSPSWRKLGLSSRDVLSQVCLCSFNTVTMFVNSFIINNFELPLTITPDCEMVYLYLDSSLTNFLVAITWQSQWYGIMQTVNALLPPKQPNVVLFFSALIYHNFLSWEFLYTYTKV